MATFETASPAWPRTPDVDPGGASRDPVELDFCRCSWGRTFTPN